ncbi:MAG: 4-alpha-glucanotransferase [Lachnospiraceae bacterium]|nr:4-alpha-glucanotransferase [Lachnospiraceae bacterium]MDD3616104.1 4-alpha-glucanotransferase [Lachnospiraceae bacterium]
MRRSGILLPVSSLPSKYGIGNFGTCAYEFVDQLKEAGQTYWQILPLGPTSYGDSPYQSFSTFAGNPYFIDLDELIEQELLTEKECKAVDFGKDPREIDYEKLYLGRFKLLRKAYERAEVSVNDEFNAFVESQAYWLKDYALFMALKDFFEGHSWIEWPEDIKLRWSNALDYYREKLYFDIEFYEYIQFEFCRQWNKLKAYANEKGIRIIGDIPIYVAFDSADTWASPELFQLNEEHIPCAVAGCPPDGFAADGQLWGNPLYRWDYHRQTGYAWWLSRIDYCFRLYDVVRIDHFRGFDEYFSIPYEDDTAKNGHWEKGPGLELFQTIKYHLGDKAIIAEDLGYVTDSVRQLVRDSGFPGMKVLEFAFDARDTGSANDYLPHNYTQNSVVYTGTHDNETLKGWLKDITPQEHKMVEEYVDCEGVTDAKLCKAMVRTAMASVSDTCIIPIQDYFGYGHEARMNTPSTLGINWKWRIIPGEFSGKVRGEILRLTKCYGRFNYD